MPDEQIQGTPPADGAAPAAPPADTTATPAPEGEKTPEQLAAEKKAADEAAEKIKTEEEDEELAARKKPWFQRRIDEITLARREAERRAERMEQTLQQAIARIGTPNAGQGGNPPEDAPKAPEFQPTRKAPTMEGCDFDQEKYMAAMVDWKLEQREAKAAHDRQFAEMQTSQQTVLKSLEEGRVKTIEDGRAKYPDFEPVVFALPPSVMNPAMLAAVLQTGSPADICYHLGKNPADAEALAKLPPLKLAVALGKLEATMAAATKRTSQAPPPPNPVGGGRTPAGLKEDELPYDEWLKRRQAGQIDGRA